MKGFTKKQFIETVNELYKNDDEVILQYQIEKLMETYGTDYYYNRDHGDFEQ